MQLRGLASILFVSLLAGACVSSGPVGDAVRGPLPTRIQHPLALNEFAFRPRRPVAQEPGTTGVALQASYTSQFTFSNDEKSSFTFDGEIAHAALRLRQGLGAGLDLEAELRGTYSGGGFLDSFVRAFHDLFGLPDAGRSEVVDNDHHMVIVSENNLVWFQEPDLTGVGDLPVVLTWSGGATGTAATDDWRYGVRAGVELPTGSEEDGLSNGGVDWGAGVMAEHSRGRWSHHLGAWAARIAQPTGFETAGLRLDDAWQLEYALELRAHPSISWLAQLQLRAPLVREIDLPAISDPILDLALGVVGDAGGRWRWFASFHEDLLSRAGPDFGFAAGLFWNL